MPSMIAAGIGAAGSIGSALIGSSAASSAADEQLQAAQLASQTTMSMFNTEQKNLAPFMNAGTSALSALQGLTGTDAGGNGMGALTQPFQPTMQQLESTPGYQFTLQQGQQATQNSYAAQGLGQSGAAQKGAAQYAENLASTTYQQQFSNYLSQNQQIYNMLGGLVQTGEGAATNTANMGMQATAQSNNYLTSGAAAGAAGTIGSANALAGGISGATGALGNYALLSQLSGMYGSGGFGNTQ